MPEQRQQPAYIEENDILEDDTIKTPAVHPSSPAPSASPLPAMDFSVTLKMPAIKKTPTTPLEESTTFSKNHVDILPMGQLLDSSTQQTQNERAQLLSLIAEILVATVTYAQKELVTVLASQAQHAFIVQTTQPVLPSASLSTTTSTQLTRTVETSETNETFSTPETPHSIVTVQEPTTPIMDTSRPQEAALSEIEKPEEEHKEEEAASPIEQTEVPVTPQTSDSFIPATPITPRPHVAPIFTQTSGQLRTRTSVVHRPQRLSIWRRILAALFAVLFIASLVLLWHDLSASHLLLTTLNPGNGTFASQQDIANYSDHPSLAPAAYDSSSIVVGLHNDATADGTHRVFAFHAVNGQWNEQTQFSAPLMHGTLQLAPTGQILINTPQALQVRSADGHLLWTAASDQPLRGVHRFHAISNRQTLYTIKSLAQSQVVAYDLHSGQTNWVQTLDDSLNCVPPFLLSESMLYIASDHNISALNNSDGTLRWQQSYPARTLLLVQQGPTPLLITAGVHGLLALNATTGQPVWTFKGQVSDALTNPELYQATTATDATAAPLIYTTGIVWRIPQIQEQVWLYAVDARTGAQVWAKQVGNSFVSADAGRLFSPLLDTTHHLVLLQQQTSTDSQNIAAFDAANGALHWTITLKNSTPATTTLLETSDGIPLILRTLTNSSELLWIFSPLRLLLLTALLGSGLMLCVLLLFPLSATLIRFIAHLLFAAKPAARSEQVGYQHVQASREKVHTGRVALVLIVCISAGILGTLRLNQTQETITQLSTHTGSIVWQHTISQTSYPLLTNAHGSVVIANDNSDTSNSGALTRLQSLNTAGAVNWQTFSSEGTFATPTTDTLDTSPANTLLVTLSGHGPRPYQFAPDDPAYQHAIDAVLVLYLFDQASGNILWQHVAIDPTEQRQGVVLGVDTHDLYIASTPIATTSASLVALQHSTGQATQLTAINRQTGSVDWHIFGPSADALVQDTGALLLHNGLAIWQVQGIVYAIDTAMGQIAWRHPLQSDAAAVLAQEERQELATPDTLLINRLDGIHALSLLSGNELWHLPELGIATSPAKAGFAVSGHILLVYDTGQLLAYDLQSRQKLWSQTQPGSIEHLRISQDGTLLYLLLLNTVQGNTLVPSVVALDTQTGAARWTFTLLGQTPLSTESADSFFYSDGTLFIISCTNTETRACNNQYLYALNGTTGKIAWKLSGISISYPRVSQDGSSLIVHTTSSAWEDLLTHIQ